MKKRNAFIFTSLIAILLALTFVFSGCNSYGGPRVSGKQDTSYVVLNNGSGAVLYGNYIYFINGYRGYDDPDGDANVWGKVQKGGLYRAELIPATDKPEDSKKTSEFDFYYGTKELNVFNSKIDDVSKLEFKSTYEYIVGGYLTDENSEFILDDDDEKIEDELLRIDNYKVDVQLIAPKTIGTSGYENGGIFIFDNYAFYASPNNNKNQKGEVQSAKTDFYRTTLDGKTTQKIYTSKSDTSTSAYMFYKWQDSYYLVLQDGTDIVSVKMDKKIDKAKTVAQDVTSVYFANKGIYYKGINENSVEDFVYYTRAAVDNDPINTGSVLEMIRPDGSEGILIHNEGSDVSIINCDNGILFYEIASSFGGKKIIYDNLFNALMGPVGVDSNKKYSPSYYNAYKDGAPFGQINGWFISSEVTAFGNKKGLYPNFRNVGEVFILGTGSDGASLYSSATGEVKKIYSGGEASFVKIEGNILYFASGGSFKSVNLYEGGEVTEYVTDAATSPTYKFSVIGDYVVYYGKVDEYADNYAFFKRLSDPSQDGKFVGHIIDADKEPEETEE